MRWRNNLHCCGKGKAKELELIEIYYPNKEQQHRYSADIQAALVGGEG